MEFSFFFFFFFINIELLLLDYQLLFFLLWWSTNQSQPIHFTIWVCSFENIVAKENKRCYIAGDFNLELLKYDSRVRDRNFINLMYAYNFFPCIDRPTRVVPGPRGVSIALTENIFTNAINHKINSGNLVTDLSDHFPNFISIKGLRFADTINLNHHLNRLDS